MHTIKILGSGCRSCVRTHQLVQSMVDAEHLDATVEKVEDLSAIMAYGIMSTPGVVIDEAVVHSGGVPSRKQVAGWLATLS